jgi:GGDEF domain-containing protein
MEAPSRFAPFLKSRSLRLVMVLGPALITMVAMLAAARTNLALAIVLNLATGVIISSALFIVVSLIAAQIADERVLFAQSATGGSWRIRPQLPSFRHGRTFLYADWYFRLRLREEIERCQRYDTRVTLLLAKMPQAPAARQRPSASEWFDERLRALLRRSDLPALLRDGSLGVILTQTTRDAALHSRLTKALSSVNVAVGLACFPEDASDASTLLREADLAADRAASHVDSRSARAAA